MWMWWKHLPGPVRRLGWRIMCQEPLVWIKWAIGIGVAGCILLAGMEIHESYELARLEPAAVLERTNLTSLNSNMTRWGAGVASKIGLTTPISTDDIVAKNNEEEEQAAKPKKKRLLVKPRDFAPREDESPQMRANRRRKKDQYSPQGINAFKDKTIVKVSLSDELECAIDEIGRLYARRDNKSEWDTIELEPPTNGTFSFWSLFGGSNSDVVDAVTTNDNQIYALTRGGKIYHSACDLNNFEEITPENRDIRGVVGIRANENRVFLLTKTGDVFVRGDNTNGACGIGDEEKPHLINFQKIDQKYFDSPIVDVAVGKDHTLFISKEGRLYSCGADDHGQLGLGWSKRRCFKAKENWSRLGRDGYVATMSNLSTIEETSGYFFEMPHEEFCPRLVMGPPFDSYRVLSVSAGDYHSAAVMATRYDDRDATGRTMEDYNEFLPTRVVSWGNCMHGQLGHANLCSTKEPHFVPEIDNVREYDEEKQEMVKCRVSEVSCGKNHTLMLLKGPNRASSAGDAPEATAMVFGCGANAKGQVCAAERKAKVTTPVWVDDIIPNETYHVRHVAAGGDKSAVY